MKKKSRKQINKEKETKSFFKLLLMKTLAAGGYNFFSALFALRIIGIDNLIYTFYAAVIGAGLYFFTEMSRYYGINPEKKVNTNSTKIKYSFLI